MLDLARRDAEGRTAASLQQILKRDPRTNHISVFAMSLAGRPAVVKCTPLTFKTRLFGLVHRSRGWRQARGAAELRAAGIPTAPVLQIIRAGGRECVVMERVPGITLLRALAAESGNSQHLRELAVASGRLIARLSLSHLFNRDHKPSNLIVSPDGRALTLIDTVAIRRLSRAIPPQDSLVRMLASQVIEPLGCGVLPPCRTLARGLRAAVQTLADDTAPNESGASIEAAHADRDGLAEWRRAHFRMLWRAVEARIAAHGDPAPRVNPLAPP
ncbi:hypothetical protein BH11PLA1_BH11PLA1_22610 [soil metagenome]